MGLHLGIPESASPTVVCLGAHSDDIEIGAGATILSLAERYPEARIVWEVFSGGETRSQEALASAEEFLKGFASREITIHEFRDGHFPSMLSAIKERFEVIKRAYDPTVLFTHYRCDAHQDHRVISDLTWQTFRDHAILEYEIPKYDDDLASPNIFIELSEECAKAKIQLLLRHFQSQVQRSWFCESTFSSLMRLRGMQCNAGSGLAEAFYGRKLVIDV